MARFFGLVMVVGVLLAACGEEAAETGDELSPAEMEELGIGDIDDLKADGNWGPALTCKPIPNLAALSKPEVVVSLDGLTLHLTDKTTGFDKVYPIGPGAIEKGASLTPTSLTKPGQVFYMRMDQAGAKETSNPNQNVWGWHYSCKIWWPDPATGKKSPVFAGLPFIRLEGAPSLGYAIHGPIDSFTLPNGGKLKRGYVSHGCIRMEAADVVELYALTKGSKVPVRIQQAVERRNDGTAVDLPQRWLLSECTSDADCNFSGGKCKPNFYAGRSFCTAPCSKYCSLDKYGYPESFCVTDPEDDTQGICTLKASMFNNACRRYPGFELYPSEPRFSQPSVKADVCLPGSQGWVGSPCFTHSDCMTGFSCHMAGPEENRPGFCTQQCTKYCPDKAGYPSTFCVTGNDGKGECIQKCSLQDDCAFDYACEPDVPRHNQPSVTASVCL